jgi:hypothetical protein
MVRHLVVLVCLLGFSSTGRAHAANAAEFTIVVDIQNYAAVEKRTLQTAQQETARIFAKMGIGIEWREDPRAFGPGDVPAFSIVMLSPSMTAEKTRQDGVATLALATSSKGTGRAHVFYDRLLAVAAQQQFDAGIMLAHVLTHELGHMIANIGHDAFGIMRKFLELKEAGFFDFTRAQQTVIRTALSGAMATNAPMFALRAAPYAAR